MTATPEALTDPSGKVRETVRAIRDEFDQRVHKLRAELVDQTD